MTEEDILLRLQMLGYVIARPGEYDKDTNIFNPSRSVLFVYRIPGCEYWSRNTSYELTGDALPLFQALLKLGRT